MNHEQQLQLNEQKSIWNRYSAGWKKWDDVMMKQMQPVGEKLVESLALKGTEHVLDIASGTGEPGLTAAALLPTGQVTAIDLSENMVEIANENARLKGVNNYHSQVAEVSRMPFGDNFFDDIICRFGTMFFPDIRSSLHEIMRVLKPNGKLAVAVWASPQENSFISLLGFTVTEKLKVPKLPPDAPGIFRFAKPGLLSGYFGDAGLAHVTEDTISGEVFFHNFEEYWELSTDVAGPIMEMLNSQSAEVIEEIKQEIFKKATNLIKEDGTMHTNWKAIIITGVKK
jgi:ubiquinone/menaquinone biosynthesis C-methylase UbiE